MLSQADTDLIARLRSDPWPDPQHYPLPSPLQARASAAQLLASGLFAFMLAGAIVLMLRENAQTAEAYEGWRLWIRVLAAIGIACLGVPILIAGANALLRPSVLVSLTPAGLSAPGLFTQTVPWNQVVLAVHDKPRVKLFGQGRIVMGIRGGERFGRVDNADLKPAAQPGGLDAAQLPQMLTVRVDALFRQIQAYRAHFGNAGSP